MFHNTFGQAQLFSLGGAQAAASLRIFRGVFSFATSPNHAFAVIETHQQGIKSLPAGANLFQPPALAHCFNEHLYPTTDSIRSDDSLSSF
jgi:hypothetical protein